jgi:plastocyanin
MDQDSSSHSITHSSRTPYWNSSITAPGLSFQVTFLTTGTFTYFDALNSTLIGRVFVVNPTTTTTSAPPTTSVPQNISISWGVLTTSPRFDTIYVGQSVTWRLDSDNFNHTITHVNRVKYWNATILVPGSIFTVTFNSPGNFSYFDALNTSLFGKVIVLSLDPTTSTSFASSVETTSSPTTSQSSTTTISTAATTSTTTTFSGIISWGSLTKSPRYDVITVGQTITWVLDQDSLNHSVTHSSRSKYWISPTLSPGDRFSVTFSVPGTFSYFDSFNTRLIGQIVVSPASSSTVAPEVP